MEFGTIPSGQAHASRPLMAQQPDPTPTRHCPVALPDNHRLRHVHNPACVRPLPSSCHVSRATAERNSCLEPLPGHASFSTAHSAAPRYHATRRLCL
jgi:hypothetical protein